MFDVPPVLVHGDYKSLRTIIRVSAPVFRYHPTSIRMLLQLDLICEFILSVNGGY